MSGAFLLLFFQIKYISLKIDSYDIYKIREQNNELEICSVKLKELQNQMILCAFVTMRRDHAALNHFIHLYHKE